MSRLTDILQAHGLAAVAAAAVEAVGEELRERTREGCIRGPDTCREWAALVDAEDGSTAGAPFASEQRSEINIGAHVRLMEPGHPYVQLHTHPDSVSLSVADATELAKHPGFHTMVAVGLDGTWYVLSKRAGAATPSRERIEGLYAGALRRLASRYLGKIEAGTLEEDAAWREMSHQAWRRIAPALGMAYARVRPDGGSPP